MTKGILFFALICIIGIILWVEARKFLNIEPFQAVPPPGASPTLNVPKAKPDPSVLYPGSPQGYTPPTTALLSPPPGQTASVNSYPYEDPALKKASVEQIKNAFTSLNGFMVNEAPGLNKLGDPSATLPLGTARADRQRLEDEVNVLKRNPGLQSSLTVQDLNEIEANLGYLQKKYRLSVNSMSVEGFQSDAASAGVNSLKSNFFGDSNTDYFGKQLTDAAAGYATSAAAAKKPATIAQLQDLIARIGDEITKLSESGSTDPVLTRRIESLTRAVKIIQTIINKVTVAQTMKLSEIPITESVYYSFLSSLDDVNSALPDIGSGVDGSGGSSGSGSGGSGGRGSNFLSGLFADLSGLDISGISFDMNLRYTGRNEMKLADDLINTIGLTKASASSPGEDDAPQTGYRGAFDSIIKLLTGGSGTLNAVNTDTTGGGGTDGTDGATAAGSGSAGSFAWKERASFICDQIQKREMDPNDYGCLKDTITVSENFSYRGYAKMICSRLGTNYDPGIPELCGCPPPEWAGWRQ